MPQAPIWALFPVPYGPWESLSPQWASASLSVKGAVWALPPFGPGHPMSLWARTTLGLLFGYGLPDRGISFALKSSLLGLCSRLQSRNV